MSARNLRYVWFNELLEKKKIDFLCTAHHLNDQIETLFIKEKNNSDWISRIGIREKYNKLREQYMHENILL